MFADGLLSALGIGIGALVALELVYFLLRRGVPRYRPRLLYHLWAISTAAWLALPADALPETPLPVWKILTTEVVLMTTIIAFSFFEALILVRPWNPRRGAMMPKLARDVVRLLLLVAVVLGAASLVFGQPLSALLVSSTAAIALLGLALQDLLKNVFAGMSMQIEKSFHEGDWLQLNEGGQLAQVQDMSWRATRLRTQEGVEISEPNSSMAAAKIFNYGSGRQPVAFLLRVGLPYRVPPGEAKAALLQAVSHAPYVAETPAAEAFVEGFGDSAINYKVRVWTHLQVGTARFHDTMYSRIWYQLQRQGIEVPFPIRTVELHSAAAEAPAALGEEARRAAATLERVPLLRELSPEVLGRLAATARRQHFDGGETLVSEGQHGDSLFVIERGRVRVSKGAGADPGASLIDLATLGEGDFFGEMSLLTGEPRSATVTAEAGCQVLVLSHEAVAPVLLADPTIAEALSRSLAARAAQTEAKLEAGRGRAKTEPMQQSLLRKIRSFFSLPEG